MGRQFSRTFLVLSLIVASAIMAVGRTPIGHSASSVPLIGVWSSACSSSNLTLSSCPTGSLSNGKTILVHINVTNSLPNNGFETVLFYDPSMLSANSIDLKTGTVWTNPFPVISDTTSQPGAVLISMVNNSPTPIVTDGILANINFTIKGTGVSPLTLGAGMASPSGAAKSSSLIQVDWTRLVVGSTPSAPAHGIDTATLDGYFMNQVGKRGPVSVFTYSPLQPRQGVAVSFNASQSYDLDNAAAGSSAIRHFYWDFGDGQNGLDSAFVQHIFAVPGGNYSARLTVVETDDSFLGMSTQRIFVAPPPLHDVAISGISTSPTSVNVGGKITVTVNLFNKGTYTENYNLTVTYGTPAVQLGFNQSTISPSITKQHAYTIDTSGLAVGSYQVTAVVKIPFANVTSDETQSAIFTVTAVPNITQLLYIGLGVVGAVAAIAVVVVVMRRRRRPEDS
jgi:cohesin domain-containing protein/PKD domain-containing protein